MVARVGACADGRYLEAGHRVVRLLCRPGEAAGLGSHGWEVNRGLAVSWQAQVDVLVRGPCNAYHRSLSLIPFNRPCNHTLGLPRTIAKLSLESSETRQLASKTSNQVERVQSFKQKEGHSPRACGMQNGPERARIGA